MKKKIEEPKKIVLAYSGGLDTSSIIPWLKENYLGCEVVAFVANIGQSENDLKTVESKAFLSGASECHIIDLQEEFVSDYIYPILQTGAIYEGVYLLGTAIARPLIAKAQVNLALKLGADTLCHGATGKGNDQVRFETAYAALAPKMNVIAPWREWNLLSRDALLVYLKNRKIPISVSPLKIYSRDENIFHLSTEGGILEDTWNSPNSDCWMWCVDPLKAPNKPEEIHLVLERGQVKKINGEPVSLICSLKKLNVIGSKHGIGRVDFVENRLLGIKSRGCYETPGGTIILNALRALEQLVFDRDSLKWRQKLGENMSYLVYDGKWFSPLRESIQASMEVLSKKISGEVVVRLYKGNVTIIQKSSKNTLYSREFATFGQDEVYDHKDASGFVRIFSLSSRIRALNEQKK